MTNITSNRRHYQKALSYTMKNALNREAHEARKEKSQENIFGDQTG